MRIDGTRQIAAPPREVWHRLNDPDVLEASIAGCTGVTRTGERDFEATLRLRFGPFTSEFDGHLSLCDVVAGESYTIVFEGLGRAAGKGRGVADVTMAPTEAGTRLDYAVEARIGGRIARLGSALIEPVVRRMIEDFFDRFERTVAAGRAGTESD